MSGESGKSKTDVSEVSDIAKMTFYIQLYARALTQTEKSYLICKLPGHSSTTFSLFSWLKEAPAACKIFQLSTEEQPSIP